MRLTLLHLIFFCLPLLANVDLRTSSTQVGIGLPCEQAGIIQFVVNGGDFNSASLENPIYIRLRIYQNATLCQTLVDYGETGVEHHPIYLAMELSGTQPGYQISADPQAVSIARWREGEDVIWIKVQQSSRDWITDGVNFFPPSYYYGYGQVRWTIGVTARTSHLTNAPLFNQGLANRPANQRETGDDPLDLDFVSTLLCVDLNPSTMGELNFDVITFVHPTGLETDLLYTNGSQYGVFFSGSDQIGNISYLQINAAPHPNNLPVTGFLCEDEASANGLVAVTNRLITIIDSDYSWHTQSHMLLEVNSADTYGFPVGAPILDLNGQPAFAVNGAQFIQPFLGGLALAYQEDLFLTAQDETLARKAYLIWADAGQPYAHFDLETEITLAIDAQESPINMEITATPVIFNHDSEVIQDGSNYSGSQSHCARTSLAASPVLLDFGSWELCFGTQASYWPLNISLLELVELVNQAQLRSAL